MDDGAGPSPPAGDDAGCCTQLASQLVLTPPAATAGDAAFEGLAAAAKLRAESLGAASRREAALLAERDALAARLQQQQAAARDAERRLGEERLAHRKAAEALEDRAKGLRAEVRTAAAEAGLKVCCCGESACKRLHARACCCCCCVCCCRRHLPTLSAHMQL